MALLIANFVKLLLLLTCFHGSDCLPEPGKIKFNITEARNIAYLTKVSFNGSKVHLKAHCTPGIGTKNLQVIVEWRVKYSSCGGFFVNYRFEDLEVAWSYVSYAEEIRVTSKPQPCSMHLAIPDFDGFKTIFTELNQTVSPPETIPKGKDATRHEAKRNADERANPLSYNVVSSTATPVKSAPKSGHNCTLSRDGPHLLMFKVTAMNPMNKENFSVDVELSIEKDGHYLSAAEWPLLLFFGCLSLLYLVFAIVWLVFTCWNWRDLLRVQFWIGAVIALGMLETALFYSDYQNINGTGIQGKMLAITAELVSSMKRTLARILVIIVSLGFGIVKPRLGSALHKILVMGGIFFTLSAIDGCFRAITPKANPSRQQVFAAIPLAVMNSAICWWIFSALVQTTRTLRIRKNVVKLSLYRHFTNTLIFLVIASVAFMLYSIKQKHFSECYDWRNLWLDEAFWPFLFTIILVVIMILWRPTNNNQRYAFAPLMDLDSEDEGDDNKTLSDAFEGMKMRSVHNGSNGQSGQSHYRQQADDDLKWVEENIPSVPSTLLPTLDSDEELMTTRYEMSKME